MPTTPRQREAAFQADVIKTLRLLGYLATSIRRSDGVTIGDTGLPDVLAVHPTTGAFLALELKADPGRHATPAQVQWLDALAHRADVARVVRPDDWHDVALTAAELAGHTVARP